MINQPLTFTIKTNSYTIDDVRIKHFIDFEKMKASVSAGLYGSIFRMGTMSSDEALTMIDIESFFNVFCPQVLVHLEAKDFKELGFQDYLEIKEIYSEKIVPWYNNYIKILRPKKTEG